MSSRLAEMEFALLLPVTVSFYVTILPQSQSGTLEGIYAAADRALYAAKNNGHSRVKFYTPR